MRDYSKSVFFNSYSDFPELIETTVFPTVGEDVERQYVCVTLSVMPSDGYPDVSPKFNLKNPRGLDDCSLNAIQRSINAKLEESVGLPVVFDLIEVIREHLTSSNLPSGQCVVCLYGFREGDTFTKTECYHFLHSFCLARHLIALKKNHQEEYDKLPGWQQKVAKPYQPLCPVCRELINDGNVDELLTASPPSELENAPNFKLTKELKILQTRMTNLFLRQKARGGIIDLDASESTILMLGGDDEVNETKHQRVVVENSSEASGVSSTEVSDSTGSPTATANSANSSPSHRNYNYQKYSNNRGPHNYNNRSSGHHSRQNQQSAVVSSNQEPQTNTADVDGGRRGDDEENTNYNHRHHNRHRRGPHRHQNHHNRHHHHHNNTSNGSSQQPPQQQQQSSAQQSCSSNPR